MVNKYNPVLIEGLRYVSPPPPARSYIQWSETVCVLVRVPVYTAGGEVIIACASF